VGFVVQKLVRSLSSFLSESSTFVRFYILTYFLGIRKRQFVHLQSISVIEGVYVGKKDLK